MSTLLPALLPSVVSPPSLAVVRGALPPRRLPPGHCVAQDGKLPLHYAAEKGAPFDVMKLLLNANTEAAAAADKARSSAHAGPTLRPSSA